MQWIDAIGYEEVMTFLLQYTGEPLFQGYGMPLSFYSDVRTSSPTEKGRKRMCWARQIWRSGAARNRPAFIMSRTRRCLPPAREPAISPRCPGRMGRHTIRSKRSPVVLEGKIIGIVGAYW